MHALTLRLQLQRLDNYLLHQPGFVGESARSIHALVATTTLAHFKQEASKAVRETWNSNFYAVCLSVPAGIALMEFIRDCISSAGLRQCSISFTCYSLSTMYMLFGLEKAPMLLNSSHPTNVVNGWVAIATIIVFFVPRHYFLGLSLTLFAFDVVTRRARAPLFSNNTHIGLNCMTLGYTLHPQGALFGLLFSIPLQASVRLIENLMASQPFTTCKSRLDLAVKAVAHLKET